MAAVQKMQRKKVIHLVGSRQDTFYHDLSVLYARACDSCDSLDRDHYEFFFAHVHTDGMWSFPADLSEESVATATKMSTASAIAHLEELAPDVMVPHMFCVEGMTRFRSLFDVLKIPYLGNREYTVWPSTDKAQTKFLLQPAGIPVPKSDLLVKGQVEEPSSITVPFVVKPCKEDNSRGITLVRNKEDAAKAIEYAFTFDDRVLVEEYIAGREIRAAVVEKRDGSLTVLPKVEYFLTDIRTPAHKLATDDNGKLKSNAIVEAKKDGDRKCPADCSSELHARIDAAVLSAHQVLNCRHYSIYDLRIDAAGNPYVLEAALFCSFSPLSVIPSMAQHSNHQELQHPHFFHGLLEKVIAENQDCLNEVKVAALQDVKESEYQASPEGVFAGMDNHCPKSKRQTSSSEASTEEDSVEASGSGSETASVRV